MLDCLSKTYLLSFFKDVAENYSIKLKNNISS